MPKESKRIQSIRIKLEGNHELADIRLMMHEAINELEARGIGRVKNCNLYITPVCDVSKPEILDTIIIGHPYRSAADEHGV